VVLFTKCGLNIPHANRPDVRVRYYDTSSAHILKSVDNSLLKLRTDYIDIFLLDQLDALSNLEETAVDVGKTQDNGQDQEYWSR
jgi:predicted oxidoreductase